MRKQFIVILLLCLALVGLTVSCNNEVTNAGFGEELVSISFKNDSARGLTASLETFKIQDYYWAYAAQKADNSKLSSGQTASYDKAGAVWVNVDENNKPVAGLGIGTPGTELYVPYQIPGFSQGYWNFKLYAFRRTGDGTAQSPYKYDLIYEGETKNVVLKNDSVNTQGSHSVNVIVNPTRTTDNGTLLIDTTSTKKITLNTVSTDAVYTIKVLSVEDIVPEGATPTEYVGSSAETQVADNTHNGLFSLPAGSYKVTVAFTDSGNTVNYARGMVVATVYSNLTTTIGGDLTEAMTYAEFNSELNPELVTVTASKDGIEYDSVNPSTKTVSITTDTSAAKAVTAEIKKTDTNTLITDLATKIHTNTDDYDQALKLTLKVETVEVEQNTATYEIGMSAKLTSTNKGTQAETSTTSDVTAVADYVTVTVQLQTGFTEVVVFHSGVQMNGGVDVNIDQVVDTGNVGKYSYNSANGVLTIQTKTFSPFKVTYTAPAESVYVAKIGNYKYTSLKNAVDNAKAGTSAEAFGDTIVLLADYTLAEGEALSKDYVALDLAGHILTVPSGKTLTLSGTGAAVITGSIALTGAESLVLSGSNTVVSDVTVTGGTISVSGTGVEIEDCVIDSGDNVAINMASNGSATIDGGTYTATSGILSNGDITVVDGVFKGTIVNGTGEGITLTGGTYNEALPEGNKITIPEGYAYKMVSDNVYNILKETVVRNVTKGGIEYYTLSAAFEDANSGNELLMLNSTEVPNEIEIPVGKTLSLDLNGKVITGTEHNKDKAVFRNSGNLTINGTTADSAINADATVVASVTGSILTVNGGSYSNSHEDGAYLFDVKGTASINGIRIDGAISKGIRAKGSSAEVTVSNSNADVSPKWGLFAAGDGGKLTITSGEYTTTYAKAQQMIDIKGDGRVVITGGEFNHYSSTGAALVVFNSDNSAEGLGDRLEISGGTFTINNGTTGYFGYGNGSEHEVISITGGTFNVNSVELHYRYGLPSGTNVLEYSITGGTFSSDPSTYVAPGYEAIYNVVTPGMWTVLQITPERGVVSVERVNADPVYFLNFEDAVDYVESGDTINILKDCTASYHGDNKYDFSGKDITIHVNEGITLSCGDVTNGKFDIGWGNAAGTLTLEGPGKITFTSNGTNGTWGLITDNGVGNDIKAVVKNITIEASSANGYIMTGGHLTVESGYYKNIAFDYTGKAISGGYYTTDVSKYVISGKRCMENSAYPSTSDYQYYITDSDPIKNFLKIHGGHFYYYENLADASDGLYSAGDILRFISSNTLVTLETKATDQLWTTTGVIYDLNGHTLTMNYPNYNLILFDCNVTVMDGRINVPANKFCADGCSINAINVHFADALFSEVMEHVSGGYYVKDEADFFAIQESIPAEEDVKAKILRGGKYLYFTCSGEITVQSGDYVYVYDQNETFVLSNKNDSITVKKMYTGDFPSVEFKNGDIEETVIAIDEMKYTAIPLIVCQATKAGSQQTTKQCESLEEGFDYIKSTGGTVTLLKDIYLNPSKWITIDFNGFATDKTFILDFAGKRIVGKVIGGYGTEHAVEGLMRFENLKNGSTVEFMSSDSSHNGGVILDNSSSHNCWRGLFYFSHDSNKPTVNVVIESGFYSNFIKDQDPTRIVYYGNGTGHTGTSNITISGGTYVMHNGSTSNMVQKTGSSASISGVTVIDGDKITEN